MSEWTDKRKGKISASNAAVILGLKPFGKTPIDAWKQIIGYGEDRETTEAQEMGKKMEEVIASLYADSVEKATSIRPSYVIPDDPIQHSQLPWLCGTPDRLIIGQKKGIEIKNVGLHMLRGWGAPGTDEIPDYYLIQAIMYMSIMDYPSWDVVACLAGGYPTVYTLRRDEAFEMDILKKLEDWYIKHIVGNTPPEPDGTENYHNYLKERWPRNTRPMLVADSVLNDAIGSYIEEDMACSEHEVSRQFYRNVIESYLKDAEGAEGSSGIATWRKAKDSVKTDYKSLFNTIASLEGFIPFLRIHELDTERIVGDFTKTVEGSRRFLVKAAK